MNLTFDPNVAAGYRSRSQAVRRLTEDWFDRQMYCVECGRMSLDQSPNNARVNDFSCRRCGAVFELKSGSKPFGPVVPDGAYGTMMHRLAQGGGPHLVLMHYTPVSLSVRTLVVIPSVFFTSAMILPRRPLAATARRAGWVGCNIRVGDVPAAGRVLVVEDGRPRPTGAVAQDWRRARALRERRLPERTWMVDVLRCVERLERADFTLADAYGFETELQALHPANNNIRPKIRQQLQRLRDAGWLRFRGDGRYQMVAASAP